MRNVICKPCFAFEALGSLVFCNYYRTELQDVKEWVCKTYEGLNILPGNSYFDILTSRYDLDEIEKFDLNSLCGQLHSLIEKGEGNYSKNEREQLLRGIQALRNSNFAQIWNNRILPVLENNCKIFYESLDQKKFPEFCRTFAKYKKETSSAM